MARSSPRKKRPIPPSESQAREVLPAPGLFNWRLLDPEIRASGLYGLLAAIVGVGLFIFPVQVDPIEALSLWITMTAFGMVLALRAASRREGTFLRAAGTSNALAVFALALWALLRWRVAEFPAGIDTEARVAIPSAGRQSVIALQFFAAAFGLGLGLGTLGRARSAVAWKTLRGLLAAATFGFALLAIYQFSFGYERMLERLRETGSGREAMDPLLLQSLEHALGEKRVGGTLGNGNIFAAWLAILSVITLSWLTSTRRTALKIGAISGYLLGAFALLLTGSRGGILTLLVATLGAIIILKRTGGDAPSGASRTRPGLSSGTVALFFSAGSFFLLSRSAWAIDIGYRLTRLTTIRERLNYWTVAARVWGENILIGAGPGAFELYYPGLKALTSRESRYAHSWIFHTGSELGLVGLVLLLIFWTGMGLAAWTAWRSCRTTGSLSGERACSNEALWLALICFVLGFNGLFEYSLQTHEFLSLLGLCAGGLVGLTVIPDKDSVRTNSGAVTSRAIASGFLALAVFGAGIWMIPPAQLAAHWEWRGEGAMLADEPLLAAGCYSRAAKWIPDEEGYLVRWSSALLHLPGRRGDAGALLERAELLNPLSPRIRAARSRLYAAAGQDDLAIGKMDEAIELYPSDAGYRIQRAQLFLSLGRTSEAREDIAAIEALGLPIWGYLRPQLDALREELDLDKPESIPGEA